ncbi:MAG: ABC transporter permease subunit [Anaerolineales bacterium]|nr:ABC transporter permease subunit [Anaerolineales bacterium]
MNKVIILIKKEWAELFKNRLVLGMVIMLPILFTALSLIMLATTADTMGASVDLSSTSISGLPEQFTKSCEGLNSSECMQYFVSSEFLMMFMIMPVIIPITIAAYSIVGEKTTSTLEPLLATPISTMEILLGKGSAAVIPSLIATWGAYGIFAIGSFSMVDSKALLAKLFSPAWVFAVFVIGPLLAIAAVSIAVMISSRVTDPRVAEQLSGLVVLPIIGVLLAQSFGLILVDQILVYILAVIMILLDIVLLYFATQLFQRESILTRWK